MLVSQFPICHVMYQMVPEGIKSDVVTLCPWRAESMDDWELKDMVRAMKKFLRDFISEFEKAEYPKSMVGSLLTVVVSGRFVVIESPEVLLVRWEPLKARRATTKEIDRNKILPDKWESDFDLVISMANLFDPVTPPNILKDWNLDDLVGAQ